MTTIEPLAPEHFELVASWLSRPEINRWLTGEWRDRPATPSIIAIALRNRRNRMFLVKYDGAPCGLVALADIDSADHNAMVWYLLGDERFAGKGIISSAVMKLVQIAFTELQLSVVYAWIMEHNQASRRVLEKSGFRECGRIRDSASWQGKQVSRIYFDIVPVDASV